MNIVEARKPKIVKGPDLTEIENSLKNAQSFLSKHPFGIKFSNEWVDALKTRVGDAKLGHEKTEAENLSRHGNDHEPSAFDAKDMFLELVPKFLSRVIHSGIIIRDIERAEQEYQNRHVNDPEDPMDYIEDSDVIRFNHVQKNVVGSLSAIIPSHPDTFMSLIHSLESLKAVEDHKMQHEELILDEDLKEILSKLIPLLRICNLLKSRL